jgi:hypothetical protein
VSITIISVAGPPSGSAAQPAQAPPSSPGSPPPASVPPASAPPASAPPASAPPASTPPAGVTGSPPALAPPVGAAPRQLRACRQHLRRAACHRLAPCHQLARYLRSPEHLRLHYPPSQFRFQSTPKRRFHPRTHSRTRLRHSCSRWHRSSRNTSHHPLEPAPDRHSRTDSWSGR